MLSYYCTILLNQRYAFKGLSQNIRTYYHVSTYELNELFRISKRTNIQRSSFGVKTEVRLRMSTKRS